MTKSEQTTLFLTGGGTAGHVSLNQAILPILLERGYDVHYVGSQTGIEHTLLTEQFPEVPFHCIQNGKLRRYASWKNATDPFRIAAGIAQSVALIRRHRPALIFSKGGFVSVPLVLAARVTGTQVVIHESDVTPGLANRIAVSSARHIFTVFPETLRYLPAEKSSCTGAVIRPQLLSGSRDRGLRLCGFTGEKPVLLVMGGSQGSAVLNEALRSRLSVLCARFDIVHLCGAGHLDAARTGQAGYRQFEYATTDLADLLRCADYAVSRAGSNAIFEFLTLRLPMLLVPLSAKKSRGDQIVNARLFEQQGMALVLQEENLAADALVAHIDQLVAKATALQENMEKIGPSQTTEQFVAQLERFLPAKK